MRAAWSEISSTTRGVGGERSGGRTRACRGQSGASLLEALVAISLAGIMVSGISSGIIVMVRSSSAANVGSRANVLATSFGETLKQLGYRSCDDGDLVSLYTEAFDLYEEKLPDEERLIPAGSSNLSVEITDVDTAGGCVDGAADTGEQTILYRVTVRDTVRTGQVVKRNHDATTDGPIARADVVLMSTAGDPQGIFSLSAVRSTPLAEIIQFRWDCGDTPPTTMEFDTPDAPGAICTYQASTDAATYYTVTLVVVDVAGNQSTSTVMVTVPKAHFARPAPHAVINATPVSGNVPLTVSFNSNGSNSLAGTIVSYQWDFGDPLSGDANTSTAANPTNHRYERPGTFRVTLKVTDEIGLVGTAWRDIVVSPVGTPPPTPRFTVSPDPDGAPIVVPQVVSFDGRASTNYLGQPVSSYQWDFGDGASAPGSTTSRRYTTAGTYTVTLTVTDHLGKQASATRQITVRPFEIPSDFRLTGSKPEFFSDGHFYFAWRDTGVPQGSTLEYEIRVRAVAGCIAFGTQTRKVAAQAAGTWRTYDFRVSWPASNVCAGSQYDWSVRAVRTTSDGTTYSSWTPNKHFWV